MGKSNVEQIFNWLNDTTELIQQHEQEPYLDSLATTLEILFYQDVSPEMDDILSHKLEESLNDKEIKELDHENVRKAIQLAILKGMKDSTQPNHLMTPETVAFIIQYLVVKLTDSKKSLRLFDPVSGTGNLLTTVMTGLDKDVTAIASEIDTTLIKLGLANANLQEKEVEFFQQDSLRPFLLDPVDVVIGDLPVGYYPDDVRAEAFELQADVGHSYAHHLLIEQSINYTKDGGFLVFVIPNGLFESDQADKLHTYLHEHVHIIGLLHLAESTFKSKEQAKSILVLQKKGNSTHTPKQPLLVKLPSFKDTNAMKDILGQMNNWFTHNKLNS